MWDTHQKIIAAAVLFILGGAIGFWLGRSAGQGWSAVGPVAPSPVPPSGQGTVLVGGNAIAVNDQSPGSKVAVSLVSLAADGWVVIHDERDGTPASILGARRFDVGANQTGSVDLLRPTEEGKVYYAMLHADDGDRQFDHEKDLPIRDSQGNAILMRFVASAAPPER